MTRLVDINFDVDTYIAEGGHLLDLEMTPTPEERLQIEKRMAIATPITRARVARIGRFLGLVGAHGSPEALAGAKLTEGQLLALWLETAESHTSR